MTAINKQPLLEYATPKDLDQIHLASLEVLEGSGVEVHLEEARRLLLGAGAQSGDGPLVFIPAGLVEKALASAGAGRVTLWSRTGKPAMELWPRQVYFGTGSDLEYTLDHRTGEARRSVLADVERAALLCDALENIDFVMSFALPSDVPPERQDLACFLAMVRNTTKPILATHFTRPDNLEAIWQAACDIAGGPEAFQSRPFFALYGQFVSPFRHNADSLERLLFCAQRRIPLIYVPTIMTGMSGPVTLAGSLAVANAEVLTGLTLHQLAAPGAPFIYGGCVSAFDMRNACFSYGGPEWRIADSVLAQFSRRYRLPVFSTGGCTDSKTLDQQAMVEMTFSLLMAALSGCNLIHDVGYMESGLCGSLTNLALADEIIGMTRRVLGPLRVDPETLATALIKQVGPGGTFADTDHTLRHHRQETWYPTLFDRRVRHAWSADGAATTAERAARRVDELLAGHHVQSLPAAVEAKLKASAG